MARALPTRNVTESALIDAFDSIDTNNISIGQLASGGLRKVDAALCRIHLIVGELCAN